MKMLKKRASMKIMSIKLIRIMRGKKKQETMRNQTNSIMRKEGTSVFLCSLLMLISGRERARGSSSMKATRARFWLNSLLMSTVSKLFKVWYNYSITNRS